MVNVKTETILNIVDGYHISVLNISIYNQNKTKQIISTPTQIGCNNSCSFCISRHQNLVRNLTTQELLQLIESVPIITEDAELSLTGEGEPLHNLKNINQVIEHVNFSSLKIAFSGLGSHLISQIKTKTPTTLQLSLHHANQEKRNKMIPKSDSLETIKSNLLKYQSKFEKININYVVVPGENNSVEDFQLLEEFVTGTQWTVLFNPLLKENELVVPTESSNLSQVKFYKKIAQSITDNQIYPLLTYKYLKK